MKYTLLSISRGGARSLIVPLLAAVVILFFGHLSRTASQYQQQLEAVYDNTTIHGYYTDINGEQIGNLVLNAYDVANLFTTGKVSELNASIERPYYFNGISQLSDGTKTGISPLFVPDNSFRRESTIATIQRGSHLAATNDIRTSPQFYYADTVTMNFLEGFDESILTVPGDDPDALSCIIPTDLIAEEKIVLGDTIRVSMNIMTRDPDNGERIFVYIDLHVVGSYEKQGSENTIYIPLSLFFETSLIWGEGQPAAGEPADAYDLSNPFTAEQIEELQARTFHSANFKLKDSHDLHQVKNYLSEYGYSQVHNVGKVREFIILRDASFNNAVASIKQQTHYINILYPFLYALVGIISITVSYLLIVSRKYEFATMRGLGATTTRTFFNFFFEQFILCSLGTTLGAVLWYLLWETPTPTHIILSGGFLACYFIGSAVSIIIMNRSHVLTFLLDRE